MKTKKYQYLLSLILVGAAVLAAIQIRAIAAAGNKLIRLSVGTERLEYSLGEVIGLRFRIENTSAEQIDVADPNVLLGHVKLFVSSDGRNYVEYAGPNWGTVNGGRKPRKLDARGVIEAPATMLFNRRIPIDHLTPLYAGRILNERLDTDFAMLEPGHYWLKATYANGNEIYRSEPLEIDIIQPVGTNAVVWEQIKTDGAFAYLLQTGQVKYKEGSDEAREFYEKFQHIAADYPQAELTQKLDRNLDKYNRNVEHLQRLRVEREPAK